MEVTITTDGVPDKAYPVGDGTVWAACKPKPRAAAEDWPRKLPQWLLVHVPSQAWVTACHLRTDCAIAAEELDKMGDWSTADLSWIRNGVLKPAFATFRARIALAKAEKQLAAAQKKEDKAA